MRTLALVTLGIASVAFVALGASSSPPNLGKAIEAQRQLVKERPGDAQVLNDLGNLLVLGGDLDGAQASYEAAIDLAEDQPAAHYNLGLLLQQRGERRKALSEFKKVLKLQPDNAWAHFQAAVLLEAAGSESAAVEHYAAAFRLNPQLSFSEVNPQVIDSKLVTKALLQAHRESSTESAAPRDYAQPARIARLMVTPAATAPEAPPAEAAPESPEAAPAGRAPRAPAANAGARPAPQPAGGRTLRPEDLEGESGGGANSVRRGGSRITPPPPSGPTGNYTRPRIAPGVQPGPPPEPPRYTPPPEPSDDLGDDGYDVESDQVAPPPTGQPLQFIPAIQSSGRLEMKLVPDAPAPGRGRGLGR